VQYFVTVNVLESQANLDEPIHDISFREKLPLFAFLLDVVGDVPFLAVFHYYDKNPVVDERMLVGDNIGVVQHFKNLGLY